jgi:hypothetical protein
MAITYDSIAETITVLLAGAGALVLIGNAIRVCKDLKKPKADMEARVKKVEDCYLGDRKLLDDIRESQRITSKATLALIDHALHDGNNVDGLKESRNELYTFLSER